ncbi:hypothetical protein VB296_08215 [Enterobacter cloacae]|jgi:hypothetical protein|uniref:hypothetical protein n=1 Tax=Enterobacter cloacae complex TaxID=354276 RepID=UPI000A5E78F4|nr:MULTISPECIES: hypothetical protein [Enterobacter]HAV1488134.1 hypothetical protein [Enterobacter hormaechei subsp. steigerwaltii]EMC7876164.1 hypothetical protein [Enterobacter roggenkampii]MCF1340480.1 hypothetical protein [Enterobacter asburiae]MCQ4338859.1 hypothetical protein [Enterobacter asburiae]MEA5222863.1 hypothetical protein [Enterobacter cloacae]
MYTKTPGYASSSVSASERSSAFLNAGSRTTNQKTETKIINGGFFSGIALAAFLAFMNVGASTTPTHSSLNAIKPVTSPIINRSNGGDEEDCDEDNLVHYSDELQELFGFNTSQWAKLLKVERKTLYNWRNAPDTKIKSGALERLVVLKKFAEEFNPKHSLFFSKFLFGRNADAGLLHAFLKEPLILDELISHYDEIYMKLDGLVKRKALLGE